MIEYRLQFEYCLLNATLVVPFDANNKSTQEIWMSELGEWVSEIDFFAHSLPRIKWKEILSKRMCARKSLGASIVLRPLSLCINSPTHCWLTIIDHLYILYYASYKIDHSTNSSNSRLIHFRHQSRCSKIYRPIYSPLVYNTQFHFVCVCVVERAPSAICRLP